MPLRTAAVIRAWAAVTLGLLLAACSPEPPHLTGTRVFAMATWVDLEIDIADPARARATQQGVEQLLRAAERDYYAWAPDGELARLNAAIARGQSMPVSPALGELLLRSRALAAASQGLFDPGVGALVELWGFHSAPGADWRPPAPQALEAWLARPATIQTLELRDGQASSADAGLKLDLGGVAKGFVVDRVVALLRSAGVTNALVNAGGDLRVLGRHGDRPWRIGIRDPRGPGVLHAISLHDGEAAFTSGDYERYVERAGQRLHHILDPTTGRPTQHTASVTVVTTEGTTADAAATALLVAGPDRWRSLAHDLGVDSVLRIDSDGSAQMTAPMRARITAADPGSSAILTVIP
jgi:thiamine biosynthesis lipoprotein